MISERGRGAIVYAAAAVLLLAGGLWYFRAAPGIAAADPRLPAWREQAERLLPELPFQAGGETEVLPGGATNQGSVEVGPGAYRLTMVCVGEQGSVRVRMSSTGDDSGRSVPCGESPGMVALDVALADRLFLDLNAEAGSGSVVFRWRLDQARGF